MTADFQVGDVLLWKHRKPSLQPRRFTIACIGPDHFSNMTKFTDGSLCLTEKLADDYEKAPEDEPQTPL